MTGPALKLDHLAVVARSLEAGIDHVRSRLGVTVLAGGRHAFMGTHNAVMRLGNDGGDDAYLEIIAVDPDAPQPDRPRWFGLDEPLERDAALLHWVVATDDIDAALGDAIPESGAATPAARGNLVWSISIAEDGRLPMGGAFPTLIEWRSRPHPAGSMADLGCSLASLTVRHPDIERVAAFLDGRLADPRVRLARGDAVRLIAEIDTPSGRRVLD
ncbi:MAG: VOC family protein [Rhodospirillales bacterium]